MVEPSRDEQFRVLRVDPAEHGATFLAFYERSPEDATPHPRAVLEEGEGSLWLAYEGQRAVGGILTREQRFVGFAPTPPTTALRASLPRARATSDLGISPRSGGVRRGG